MPQIFIGPENFRDGIIVLKGDDFHHLARVRRIKAGESVTVRDHAGKKLVSRVLHIHDSSMELIPLDVSEDAGPVPDLVLCAGLLKGKKMDLVVQKCTEIGVGSIIPFTSRRCVSQPGENEMGKVQRWRKIAAEASKQSMRHSVPDIEEVCPFGPLIKRGRKGLRIIANPGAGRNFRNFLSGEKERGGDGVRDISLIIGPEGGFDPKEIHDAEGEGWVSLNFGFTELRAETASIVLSAVILYEMGGMD